MRIFVNHLLRRLDVFILYFLSLIVVIFIHHLVSQKEVKLLDIVMDLSQRLLELWILFNNFFVLFENR
jgi:hypothetical protein